jgi:hypothetical protein
MCVYVLNSFTLYSFEKIYLIKNWVQKIHVVRTERISFTSAVRLYLSGKMTCLYSYDQGVIFVLKISVL